MQTSRGVRGLSFTLVTPANHYPSRLPEFGDAPVVKLVTPRMAPSRIGEYLVSLPAGAGTVRPVEPGFETFLYGLEGDAAVLSGGDALALHAGGFAYLPGDDAYHVAAGERPARLLIVKRRYQPHPDLPRRGRCPGTATTSPSPTPTSPASAAASCCPPPTRRSTST